MGKNVTQGVAQYFNYIEINPKQHTYSKVRRQPTAGKISFLDKLTRSNCSGDGVSLNRNRSSNAPYRFIRAKFLICKLVNCMLPTIHYNYSLQISFLNNSLNNLITISVVFFFFLLAI